MSSFLTRGGAEGGGEDTLDTTVDGEVVGAGSGQSAVFVPKDPKVPPIRIYSRSVLT